MTSLRSSTAERMLLALALLGHLAVGPFYLASGLLAPGWAVVLLWLTWIGLLVGLVLIWRRRPALALLVPPTALLLIFLVVTAGERLLGWTA